MTASQRFYKRYEHLAKKYAGSIYQYDAIGFEYEDLLQEFRMKIYSSILSYGRRWAKYRRGEAARPVPIRFYLECACSNKKNDFMKYITREKSNLRIDEVNYDRGSYQDTEIQPESNRFIVHGVDLLENLKGVERAVFSLYLRGFTKKSIYKVNSNNESIIRKQIDYLKREYSSVLLQGNTIFETYRIDN